jgi:hypothetical protein
MGVPEERVPLLWTRIDERRFTTIERLMHGSEPFGYLLGWQINDEDAPDWQLLSPLNWVTFFRRSAGAIGTALMAAGGGVVAASPITGGMLLAVGTALLVASLTE